LASVPNYKLVSPSSRKKLSDILSWARKQPHPPGACMRSKELTAKVPDPKRRAKICAVMKDMALGTTKWRKGGNH
jgi:hypothetical protein